MFMSVKGWSKAGVVVEGVCRVALGAVLIYSALQKLYQPYDFLSSVYAYEMTGSTLGMIIAALLPPMELAIGACLLAGICPLGGSLGALLLGIVFIYAQISVLGRGLNIDCGCFGSSGENPISYATLTKAIIFCCVSALLYTLALFLPKTTATTTAEH